MPPKSWTSVCGFWKRDNTTLCGLGEGLERLGAEELPPRSVAITFDDGAYDFYSQAYPLLKAHGFPVTVYQTTYYSDYQKPIFNLMCSYLLWKRRGTVLDKGSALGLDQPMDLRSEPESASNRAKAGERSGGEGPDWGAEKRIGSLPWRRCSVSITSNWRRGESCT